jgi:hypothetical protein
VRLPLPPLGAGGGGHACRAAAWALQEFYRQLLVGKGAPQKARMAVARKLNKAVFWMLRTGRSYGKVESCLAPREQASAGAHMADR